MRWRLLISAFLVSQSSLAQDSRAPAGQILRDGQQSTSAENAEAAATGGRQRAITMIGGVGLLGLGAGTAFGILAFGRKSDYESGCPSPAICSTDAISAYDSAKTYAVLSTVAFGVGIAGVGIATYLLLTSPSPTRGRPTMPAVVPTFGRDVAGLSFQGDFP